MQRILIITNGPLTRRVSNFIQFAPAGLEIECKPMERNIAGTKLEGFWVDEYIGELKGESDE
jgi:hypothetical protein